MKKLVSLVLCILLIASNLPFVYASTVTLEVAVDKSSYMAGEKINMLGRILADGQAGKGYNPTLVLEDPSGNRLFFGQWNDNEISESGEFSNAYTLESDAVAGTYKVTVSAASTIATTSFEVEGTAGNEDQILVTAKKDKDKYTLNDSVVITGLVTKNAQPISGTDVTIVVSKDGSQLKVDQLITNKSGEYKSFYNLNPKDKAGTYLIKVKALEKETELSFTVAIDPTPPDNGGSIPIPTVPEPEKKPDPEEKPDPELETDKGKVIIDKDKGEKKLVIDEEKIKEEIEDPKKDSVEFKISKNEEEEFVSSMSIELSESIIKKITDMNKAIEMTTEDTTIQISERNMKDLANSEKMKIAVAVDQNKEDHLPVINKQQKYIADLYDFSIEIDKGQNISQFAEPIVIKIKVDSTKINNSKKTAAYYLNEQTNEWEYVGGKLVNKEWVFKTSHFSKYTIIENNITFNDIKTSNSEWAREYIEMLASRTIIKGKTPDSFEPNGKITRAQFAVLLTRALKLPQDNYQGVFKDVPESMEWSVKEIEAANAAGIVKGSNGQFRPNEKITRQQMATMIVRAIEYSNKEILSNVTGALSFKDANEIDDYAKEYVGVAAELGIINGRESGNDKVFAPKEDATRAQSAKMLYQLLEILEEL